jgi:serine/threonine-protein kinase HipA
MHVVIGENAMQEIIRVGTSAGGARAKAVIAWNPETGDIRSGQIDAGKGYEYWLIKFDGVSKNGDKEGEDVPQYTKIEYAYYLMAKEAGILMNECRLYEESGRYHFMTRRFDRDPVTGAKYHMQSLGGMAHFDFNLPGAYSYEQAAQVMRQLRLSNTEICQFFRRMVFNVLARNQDDHVKNVSFLMDRRGQWYLSPAYDMTYAYNPDGMWTGTHQMTVNGKRADISRQDLLVSAGNMGIKKAEAEQIISEIQACLEKWMNYAETAAIREATAEKIQRVFIIALD